MKGLVCVSGGCEGGGGGGSLGSVITRTCQHIQPNCNTVYLNFHS